MLSLKITSKTHAPARFSDSKSQENCKSGSNITVVNAGACKAGKNLRGLKGGALVFGPLDLANERLSIGSDS